MSSAPPSSWEHAYPEALREAEEKAIEKRRRAAGVGAPPSQNLIGLALSGGGIRSATFSLGVLQALAKEKLLRHVDYLSTVSGGGYIGSFLGAMFTRDWVKNEPRPAEKVEETLADNKSRPVDWLRENGRYLSPNGSGDLLQAAAVGIRNWVAIHVILGTLFLALLLFAEILRPLFPFTELEMSGSVYLVVPTVLFLVAVVPLGWGYWLAQPWKGRSLGAATLPPVLTGVAVFVSSLIMVLRRGPGLDVPSLVAAVSGLALLSVGAARVVARHETEDALQRTVNNLLSRWLKGAFLVTAATLSFALLDLLGGALYDLLAENQFSLRAAYADLKLAFTTGGLAVLLVVGRKLVTFLANSTKGKRLSLPLGLLAGAAALLLAAAVLTCLSVAAHGFADCSGESGLWWAVGVSFALTLAFGRTLSFLNQSSLQALYGARITRAYLGASNPERWKAGKTNLTEPLRGDGVGFEAYRPHENGGPLHIVNVTLNETVSGKSQIEQRDRKGLGMAVGPCGLSVGVRHHARREAPDTRKPSALRLGTLAGDRDAYRIFVAGSGGAEGTIEAESLDIGTWVSVSGAAFTTGLGSRTSLGLSLLCGFFNVRLGYWWDSGVAPRWRGGRAKPGVIGRFYSALSAALPVQLHLLDEFLARFAGPAGRRWYLSDGGHFENTACYELIRRRLPLIMLCDDGADPGYSFADLANLVRKARNDFGTEIEFLDEKEIERLLGSDLARILGPLENLRPGEKSLVSERHAALARLAYPEGRQGLLLVLKPTLTGHETIDLTEYHASHAAFPQEPTSDQFFDEAQWESYRKLGEMIGAEVFPALGRKLADGSLWNTIEQLTTAPTPNA